MEGSPWQYYQAGENVVVSGTINNNEKYKYLWCRGDMDV
jgi:hypothetical protein